MSETIAGVGSYSRRGHRDLGFAPGGNVRRSSGSTNPNLSAISNQPVWLGFPHRAGGYQTGGSALSSPGCWVCRYMGGLLIRGGAIILRGCGGTSTLSRGATLAARWLHEPDQRSAISNQPKGWGFQSVRGDIDPGDRPTTSPGYCSCRCTEKILIWG